ncbi:MAG: hypothetical protein LBU94_02085, partial [Clostridiales bacterium]|nr:hypothetical protein [Clostridiales bacterium]
MRRSLLFLFIISLFLLLKPSLALAFTGSGSGTEAAPYIITSPEQLQAITNSPGAHYKLGNDIDLTGVVFAPIGTQAEPFTGSLDGNNFEIRNLTIDANVDRVGLFGFVLGAEFRNIKLNNFNISGARYVGGLAGSIYNSC